MKIPVEQLYTLEGKAGPEMDRVKQAMEWLISDKANHIGEDLLRSAYANTCKPLRIIVTEKPELGYENTNGEHTVWINPNHANLIHFFDEAGAAQSISLEQILGHELTHASQDLSTPEVVRTIISDLKYIKMESRQFARSQTQYDPQKMELLIANATMTPYYFCAAQLVENILDITDQLKPIAAQYYASHPKFISYMEKYEQPALETEKKIALLRNEPFRTNYNNTVLTASAARQSDREDYYNHFKVNEKLGIPPLTGNHTTDLNFWQNTVENRPNLSFTKTAHPLIGLHMNGGKAF